MSTTQRPLYHSFITPDVTGPRAALLDITEFIAAYARLGILEAMQLTDGTTRDAATTYIALGEALQTLTDLVMEASV